MKNIRQSYHPASATTSNTSAFRAKVCKTDSNSRNFVMYVKNLLRLAYKIIFIHNHPYNKKIKITIKWYLKSTTI